MNVTSLPALPALLAGSITVVSWAVSCALALLSAPIATIPGLRPSDATRNAYMRVLVFLANLAVLVGFAWSQSVVITRAEVPALLALVAANTVSAHLGYTAVNARLAPAAPSSAGLSSPVDPIEVPVAPAAEDTAAAPAA